MPDMPNFIVFSGLKGTTTIPVLSESAKQQIFKEIPTVDGGNIYSESKAARTKVAENARRTVSEAGILRATNHVVPKDLIDKAFRMIKEFFGLPSGEKIRIHNNQSPHKRGYQYLLERGTNEPDRGRKTSCIPFSTTLTGIDFREAFKMVSDPHDEDSGFDKVAYSEGLPNLWPSNQPDFRKYLYEYSHRMRAFASAFIRIAALTLGAGENSFGGIAK